MIFLSFEENCPIIFLKKEQIYLNKLLLLNHQHIYAPQKNNKCSSNIFLFQKDFISRKCMASTNLKYFAFIFFILCIAAYIYYMYGHVLRHYA
jgi:hypothetical protein